MSGNAKLIEELNTARLIVGHFSMPITKKAIEDAIAEIERLNEVIRFAGIEVTGADDEEPEA